MYGDAGDLTGDKLFRIGGADSLNIHRCRRHLYLAGERKQRANKPFVGMAGPNLCWAEPEGIHVYHCVGGGYLLLAHLLGVKVRADLALLLVGKPYEDVSV